MNPNHINKIDEIQPMKLQTRKRVNEEEVRRKKHPPKNSPLRGTNSVHSQITF